MPIARLLKGAGLLALLAIVVTTLLWPELRNTANADNTGFKSPTHLHDPSFWANPNYAFTSNNTRATTSGDGVQQGYSEFGLNVPAGSFILGVAVQVEAYSSDDEGCELEVQLSWNDGNSYTPTTNVANLTDTEIIQTLGGTNDTWGRDWQASDFTDDNFVARVTNVGEGGGCLADSTTSLDNLQVNVYFKSLTDTGLQPPSATTAPNLWANPTNAFASNDSYATSNDDNDDQGYINFDLGVPDPSLIVGIEVQVEARSSDESGCEIGVRLSGNSGGAFTSFEYQGITDADDTYTFGGPDELWSQNWTAGNFTNENFVLEVRNEQSSGECAPDSDTFLDFVSVKVYYKPLEETGKSFPSETHEPNEWPTSPENAFADDNANALGPSGAEQGYAGFDLNLPGAAIIMGISVQVDASSEDPSGCQLDVMLSGDGGSSYSAPMPIDVTNVQNTTELGGVTELWGESWTVASFSDDNFVVKLENVDPGVDCTDNSDVFVDFLQVNVIYKPIDDEGFSVPGDTHSPTDWTATSNDVSASDDQNATSTSADDEQGFADFGFSVDGGAAITGIEVRVEASSGDNAGCELDVELSWNNGSSYTDPKTIPLTNVQTLQSAGSSTDTWDRSWIASDFDDANFVVKVTNVDPGSECDPPNTFLDYLEVNVYFKSATPPATNTYTPTNTPTITNTPAESYTPTISATPTITTTPTITLTPTITTTSNPSDTPTETDTPTRTNTPTNTTTPSKAVGDVNDDGAVNAIDSLYVLQYVAALLQSMPNIASADTNDDGQVNALDAALILQYTANLIDHLPPS